jgi:hypothetical protein
MNRSEANELLKKFEKDCRKVLPWLGVRTHICRWGENDTVENPFPSLLVGNFVLTFMPGGIFPWTVETLAGDPARAISRWDTFARAQKDFIGHALCNFHIQQLHQAASDLFDKALQG